MIEGLHFERDFEWANIANNVVYWNDTQTIDYIEISDKFNSIDYDFAGMNKWYYSKNLAIQQNKEYILNDSHFHIYNLI